MALSGVVALPLVAQTTQSVSFLDVGSERERVLRVLQILGDVPLYPWSIRQLSPQEEDRLKPKTAAAMALLPVESRVRTFGALKLKVLPIEAQAIYNSAFPYGYNDGPVWAGRGATASLSAGAAGRIGPLSFQLEPIMFRAQNTAFALAPGSIASNPADAFYPSVIDHPQRFGDTPYQRLDLGQSTVRLDVGPVAAELSNADQWWGPAIESPIILGNNAPGFAHAMIGTSHPIDVFVGRIGARLVWGRLNQSAFSPALAADSIRFMSGLVASFQPRGIAGLEVGVTRFFHSQWPADGFSHARFSLPLEGILKHSLATADNPTATDADNQLASVFARWVFPASGIEIYGEYGREDHNIDLRDLWQEPDHDAGYTIGLQRTWHRANRVFAVRGELLNTRLSSLEQGRAQAPFYVHVGSVSQGHTELGQFLGAPGGYGGGAATLAVDTYAANGRWTVRWDRMSEAEFRGTDQNATPSPLRADVLHSFGIERVLDQRMVSYSVGARAVWELNRNFVADQFNLNLTAGARLVW
jgi:hypothetical protein